MKRHPASRRLWRLLIALSLALPLVGLSIVAVPPASVGATHARSAQLSWHKTTGNTVEFHFTWSGRRSYFGSNVNVGGTIFTSTLYFDDGDSDFPQLTVIAVDKLVWRKGRSAF